MDDHRPDRRSTFLTRIAAIGVACGSLAVASCSGGGGTSLPRVGGGGGGATPTPTATPTTSPSTVPSTGPSTKPSTSPSGSPTPTATPTAAPTSTPTSVPTAGPSSSPGLACTTPAATFGPSYYSSIIVVGNVPAGGGALALDGSNSPWSKASYQSAVATPVPTSTPTTGPTTSPTAPPTRPFYFYTGTYHINSSSAPTDGCFLMFTTTDGSNINGVSFSGEGLGFVNPPPSTYTENVVAFGHVSAVSLNLSPGNANANGTISLDDGDSGTISIDSVQTVQLPLSRMRDIRNLRSVR